MKNLLFLLGLSAVSINSNAALIEINDATGQVYSYEASVNQDSELLIIGLYETRSDHSSGYRPQGTANVNISYGGDRPITLVVSSYEPTLWNFNVDSNVNINQIILNGYYEHEFTGISSMLVDNRSGSGNYLAACGYSLPYNGGGCDTNYLINQVESYTDLTLNNFSGTYRATDFTITTSPVPLPGTFWLFVSGLMGFYGMRKKI